MKFKTYPSYKDSGVEWLGEVPESWETKRLKFSVGLRADKLQAINSELSYIGLENIESWTGKFLTNDSTFEAEGTSNCFKIGDVLFGKLRPYLAKAFLTKTEGLCSSEFLVLKANKITPGFLIKFILSYDFINQVNSSSYGVKMPRASWEFVGNLSIPIPPLQDQVTIANFLDRETRRIDALVEEKNQFIELLKEKRQALISHVVTKGLDPTVKMKDSGVEWLGEVPEGWGIKKIKYLASLRSGDFITSESIDEVGDYPVYGGNGIRGYTSSFTHDGKYVLIGRQGALCGNINYSEGQFWASEHAVVVLPKEDFSTLWLGELLGSMNLNQYSVSSAQPGLSVDRIVNLKIPHPPIQEQIVIANFLDGQTTKIDTLITETQNSIALLKEHRTALISAAVTGKIDVREAA